METSQDVVFRRFLVWRNYDKHLYVYEHYNNVIISWNTVTRFLKCFSDLAAAEKQTKIGMIVAESFLRQISSNYLLVCASLSN